MKKASGIAMYTYKIIIPRMCSCCDLAIGSLEESNCKLEISAEIDFKSEPFTKIVAS